MTQLGKGLMGLGTVVFGVGLLLWLMGDKLSWLGRLPGDIQVSRPGFQFYAPLMTSLLLSVGLSLVLWLWQHWWR